jgi:hypothetical protein
MLEALANEILLELFEFLDAVELFRAFYDLNNRFNTLLLTHFRAYRINFHSVLKYRSDKLLTQLSIELFHFIFQTIVMRVHHKQSFSFLLVYKSINLYIYDHFHYATLIVK